MGAACEFDFLAGIDRAPAGSPAETGTRLWVAMASGVLDRGYGSGPYAVRLIGIA